MDGPRNRERLPLKNNSFTEDPRIDRVEEFDDRSLGFRVRERLTPSQIGRPRSYTWRVRTVLDQAMQGACVGFAWAHDLVARPAEVSGISARFARETIYWRAQQRDRYPGGSYPGASPIMGGTSVLAAAKVVRDLGYIREYRWATRLEELLAVLGYHGPVVLGCRWPRGMHAPDSRSFVAPTGSQMGSHCVLLTGVKVVRASGGALDPDRSWFTFQNSWGTDWGDEGRGRILVSDLEPLLDGADMCVPWGQTTLPRPQGS